MTDPFERLSGLLGQINVPPSDPATSAHRPIFICGAPRSGTTLLYQALSFAGELAYINNLTARFAACPPAGIALSQALQMEREFTGKSRYGLTQGLTEPHEFGRFWLDAFGLDNLLEPSSTSASQADKGAASIAGIIEAFGQDTLFKSFAYLWFIPQLATAFPQSRWIFVRRNEAENSASIARLYHSRGKPQWTSAVALATQKKAADRPLEERAYAQCRDINSLIESGLPAGRSYTVKLEDLIASPTAKLVELSKALNINIDAARAVKVAETIASD